mgnify:CR=1 FL=1
MTFPKYSSILMPILSTFVILLIWYGLGNSLVKNKVESSGYTIEEAEGSRKAILPYPNEILTALSKHRVDLLQATGNTFSSAIFGFLTAGIGGYGISLLFSSSRLFKQATYPWILVLQMTPVIILAPILVIWLGPGQKATVLITFLIGFFPVVANSTQGLVSTNRDLLEVFTICNANKWQEIALLRVPFSMPYFLTGMKIAGTLAPVGAIVGDIFAGTSASGGAGLGFMIMVYISSAEIPTLFATALLTCTLGFVFVGGINVIHWLALRNWHDSFGSADS